MLQRPTVYLDVSVAVRNEVARDRRGFDFSLVPSSKDGLNDSLPGWAMHLRGIEERLHREKPEYRVLFVTVDDVEATFNEALSETSALLTDKILEGSAAEK
jgi:hypothetical protein